MGRPYLVEKRLDETTYQLALPEQPRKRLKRHVNLLREFISPTAGCLLIDGEEDDLESTGEEEGKGQLVLRQRLTEEEKRSVKELVRWHNDLVKSKPGLTTKASISIEIGTAYPISRPPYRLDAKRPALMKEAVREPLELGIVRQSQSLWASPAIVVTKKDGAKRLCVDYRRLNAITPSDTFPLPNINDLLDKLGTASHYKPIYLRLCTDLAPSTKM